MGGVNRIEKCGTSDEWGYAEVLDESTRAGVGAWTAAASMTAAEAGHAGVVRAGQSPGA